jgi:hypothetical protein
MQEFFEFFRQVLILLIIISLYFPINVPLAALAYKVRNGAQPIPLGIVSFWVRSLAAAMGMVILSLSLLGVDAVLTTGGLPAGPVHLVMFMMYLPLGSWWMFTVFALEDAWEGLSTLLLYVFLPGFFLVLLKLVFDFEPPHYLKIREWIVQVPAGT